MKPQRLHDDEHLLLTSFEGLAAFRIALPFIRALAIYIAGHGAVPKINESLPDLTADAALERAKYRAMSHGD